MAVPPACTPESPEKARQYVIADLNSANGLYVNEARVAQRVLAEGAI